jgi:hypothetical protein
MDQKNLKILLTLAISTFTDGSLMVRLTSATIVSTDTWIKAEEKQLHSLKTVSTQKDSANGLTKRFKITSQDWPQF